MCRRRTPRARTMQDRASPVARRTLRRTSQLRGTRRGRVRPRPGSPHGCAAAAPTVLRPQRRRAGASSCSERRPPCCAHIRRERQDSALAPGICWRPRLPSACLPHLVGPALAVRGAARRDARARRAGRRAAARCTRRGCRHDGPRTTRREHDEHASPAPWPPAAGAGCRACPRAFAVRALRGRSRGKSAVFLQRAKAWSGAAFLWFTKMCTLVDSPSTNSTATGLYRY